MNWLQFLKQKSPKQRFLFVLGLLIFSFYLFLAYMVAFWQHLPGDLKTWQRYVLALLFVVYASFRFYRLIKKDENE